MPESQTAGKRLAGKVAIVTGSAAGIGSATAIELAREGADVVVNYSRSEEEAKQTLAQVQKHGARSLLVRADCSRESEIKEMVDRTVKELGGVDILVNNAGRTRFIPLSDIDEVTDADWDAILGLNVKGAFYATRACVPSMRQRGEGLVVNVSSIAGHTGAGSSIPYAVSKGAMTTLTKSLAKALAPTIRVNAVAPGIVTTRWVAGREEHVERYAKDTPMLRAASAEDVARVIVSFATHGTFLTGEVTVVDGGREMR
ncbi:MAG TPA: SDR family NAD(P)-dependent oxidoreductase [Chloroflexota bacterium]|nr:SDR family NAD(P)-dependent oxidoreductase [Chloroflexota bacterium]